MVDGRKAEGGDGGKAVEDGTRRDGWDERFECGDGRTKGDFLVDWVRGRRRKVGKVDGWGGGTGAEDDGNESGSRRGSRG